MLSTSTWDVNPERFTLVTPSGREHVLEPITFAVLERLLQTRNELVTRETLFEEVWAGAVVGDDSLYRCISQLRSVFAVHEEAPTIRTVRGVGYILEVPVERSATSAERSALPLHRRHRKWLALSGIGAVSSLLIAWAVWVHAPGLETPLQSVKTLNLAFVDSTAGTDLPEAIRGREIFVSDTVVQALLHTVDPGFKWVSE